MAGSLGDLGTFLPLLVGMAAANGLSFAAGLFFAGVFSLTTGLLFRVPLAVQPMKAIAAVAITEGLTAPQIVAAGSAVGAVILLLGLTGLIGTIDRAVPRSVVRGLQLALGVSLLLKGVGMIAGTGVAVGPDSYVTGAAAALVVLGLLGSRRVPAALVLFAAGVAITFVADPGLAGHFEVGVWWPALAPLAWGDFVEAVPRAALPQIPLTTLNSVVAVCALASGLFPGADVTPRRVAASVGIMNLLGAPFGAMPMCHGAGGLAGQYRFGARTNGSILFLGAAKVGLAVAFGPSLMAVCAAFPSSILGVMLGVSGLELARVVRDQRRVMDAAVVAVTAAACLVLGVAAGFAIGLGAAFVLRFAAGNVRGATAGDSRAVTLAEAPRRARFARRGASRSGHRS